MRADAARPDEWGARASEGDAGRPGVPPAGSHRFDHVWVGWTDLMGREARIREHGEGREPFLQTLGELIPQVPSPEILEVGCGSAIDLGLLAHRHAGVRPVALDLSSTGLQVARTFAEHLGVGLRLCCGDVRRLPFRSGWAGLVFSQGLLEHFRDPAEAVREQVRVLAPAGFLVINVPQAFTGYTVYKHLAIRRGTWPWGWEGEFAARSLVQLGRSHDLLPRRVFGYQYWRSWLEPAWVLRDLLAKVQRRNPLAHHAPFAQADRAYTRVWARLERRYGHYFMQNVVAVFQKRAR